MARRIPDPFSNEYHPFAPDGTWEAEWPPEVWIVKHRAQALGWRPRLRVGQWEVLTERARLAYLAAYGHEPPRRGRRGHAMRIVFEHTRIDVVDAVLAEAHVVGWRVEDA